MAEAEQAFEMTPEYEDVFGLSNTEKAYCDDSFREARCCQGNADPTNSGDGCVTAMIRVSDVQTLSGSGGRRIP